MRMTRYLKWAAVLALTQFAPAHAQGLSPTQKLNFEIYKELVEIDTTTATGDTAKAADAMAARLRAAGFAPEDAQVLYPAPRKGNLVARLRGNGSRRPILLLAHLDVVPAKREDWTSDPFSLVEKDGYYYARGSQDDKFMAATFIATLIRYKQEGFVPDRDIIVALETDEEILDGDNIGIRWLLAHHRDLIDAEYTLNEGGGVALKNGKPIRVEIQQAEKISVSFQFEVRNKGGHSSIPDPDNAIYHLAGGLERLAAFHFPVMLNDTTRKFIEAAALTETQENAADMRLVLAGRAPDSDKAAERLSRNLRYNAILHTTCVATMLEGGHAVNALPQLARARVNCRILPGHKVEDVLATLIKLVNDPQIAVTRTGEPTLSAPSVPSAELAAAIKQTDAAFWPGVATVPVMSTGATDGSHLRNAGIPTFGHSGLAYDVDDNRAHGRDERVSVKAFREGQDYMYQLVKQLSGPAGPKLQN